MFLFKLSIETVNQVRLSSAEYDGMLLTDWEMEGGGPWNVDNCLLLLHSLQEEGPSHQPELCCCPFAHIKRTIILLSNSFFFTMVSVKNDSIGCALGRPWAKFLSKRIKGSLSVCLFYFLMEAHKYWYFWHRNCTSNGSLPRGFGRVLLLTEVWQKLKFVRPSANYKLFSCLFVQSSHPFRKVYYPWNPKIQFHLSSSKILVLFWKQWIEKLSVAHKELFCRTVQLPSYHKRQKQRWKYYLLRALNLYLHKLFDPQR